jgi:hypothetical protein
VYVFDVVINERKERERKREKEAGKRKCAEEEGSKRVESKLLQTEEQYEGNRVSI